MIEQLSRRAAMAVATAVAVTGLAAGTAAAEPSHASTARGAEIQPMAPLSCTGWNGPVYMSISGSPNGFTVSGKMDGFTGHIQITGPNGLNRSSAKDVLGPTLDNVHGTGAGRVYVTGWVPNSDGIGWHSVGQPSCAVY